MGSGRAVSPVVGVALMLAITVLLAATVLAAAPSALSVSMPNFGDGGDESDAVQTALIRAASDDAGDVTEHYVRVHIEAGSDAAGNSLNALTVEYPSSGDAGNVSGSDIERVGIDTDGDGAMEVDAMVDVDGVDASDGGSTLTVSFAGNHNLEEGDWLVLDVADVRNPAPAGDYTVSAEVNGEVTEDGVLEVT